MPYPDRFYPVVDSVAWVTRLAALGVGTIQLRVKNLSHAAAVALIREALAATAGTAARLVVNDYWRAAIEAGAQHLHLGHEELGRGRHCRHPPRRPDARAVHPRRGRTGDRAAPRPRLRGARADLSDHAEGHAVRAAGARAHRAVEEAHRQDPAGRHRRHHARTCALRSMPPAPTASRWSATSPGTRNRMRACAPGLASHQHPLPSAQITAIRGVPRNVRNLG